jgi:SAM-dependent methyltransferase
LVNRTVGPALSSVKWRLVVRLFRAVCVDKLARTPEENMHDFDRDYGHARRFFRRLGSRLDLSGKSVLEVGCGTGPVCVQAALAGARRVVGVDIINDLLEYGRSRLQRDHPELTGTIEYLWTQGDLTELGAEMFDVVLSYNAFEHYDDPERMVATFERHLHKDGIAAIAFGPLWKSPYGGHITFMTMFPWAHLVFPEPIIMSERRRLIPSEGNAQRFEDALGGLNRMTLSSFRRIMQNSGLECLYLETNVSEKRLMTLFRLMSRIPGLEEYCAHNVYSIWRLD